MKKIKFILFLIIIILLACAIMLLAYKPKEKVNIVINDLDVKNEVDIENIILLMRTYTGEAKVDELSKKLKEIATNYLPSISEETKNLTDKELETYFTKNKKDISEELEINNQDEFKKLIQSIRKMDSVNINSVEIDLSEYKETSEYANFKIYFKNINNQRIVIDAYLNMKDSQGELIKFIPIIEE